MNHTCCSLLIPLSFSLSLSFTLFYTNSFGTRQISVSKYVGKMCDLLGDATVQVRGTAMESLVEIYRHVGVKVRMDLSKRDIPGPKLQQIFQKFDEIDKGENIQSGDEVNYFLVLEKITEV